MKWKTTIILAALTASAFVAWIVVQPAAEETAVRETPFAWRESQFQFITIRPSGQPEIVLRRESQPVQGSLWRLANLDKPADDARVADMIAALRRLSREMAIKPGSPEHTPSAYGLDAPAVSVEVAAAGEKRTVKFGNASTRRPDLRYFLIEGEPEIYLGLANTAPPFQRPVAELRSKSFLTYDPAGVMKIEVAAKILRPQVGPDRLPVKGPDGKVVLKADFEKLRFEFRDQAAVGKVGWYLVSVNGEERDELAEVSRLGHLITGLRNLSAEDFVELKSPEEHGFDAPEMTVRLDILQPPSGETKPVFIEVGRSEEQGTRKVAHVRIDGGREAAVVSAAAVERIPRERKQFISPDLLDFDPSQLETVEMVTATGHKVKIVKTERDEKRGQETFKAVAWNVAEPAGLPVEPNAPYDFVAWLVRVTVSDVLGVQPDLRSFGLDPPAITLTLRFRPRGGELQERVYKIGSPGDSAVAYLLRPGSQEVYQFSEDIWRKLDRADLNFRQLTLFDIRRDQIVGVSFAYSRDHLSANPVQYGVRRNEQGLWEFENPDLKRQGIQVDRDRMVELLGALNFVRAEAFLSRNPRVVRYYELDAPESMGRLVIKYADSANPGRSAEKVFRISKSFLDTTGRARHYYAKIEPAPGDTDPSSDATIVFRIRTELIELLRQGVVYEKKGDPGFRPGQPDPPPPPPPPK